MPTFKDVKLESSNYMRRNNVWQQGKAFATGMMKKLAEFESNPIAERVCLPFLSSARLLQNDTFSHQPLPTETPADTDLRPDSILKFD
jgi:hypothetical protein